MTGTFRHNPIKLLPTDTREQGRLKLARIAMDEMYQFVAVLDAKGTLLEVNRAALEGGGLKLSDVEGKPFWECYWRQVSKETREDLKKAILRAAQGEFVRYDVEVYARASGTETIIIDFSMIPVRDESGEVAFIVPEGRDITEKKAYERAIAQKNVELAELDRAKSAFFSNVSREFRTPLTLVLGPVDDMLAKTQDAVLTEDRAQLMMVQRNGLRLLKLVNTLLDFSRIEAGRVEASYEPTDLASATAELAANFRSACERAGLELVVACPPLAEPVYVDREMWEKIVLNLVSNALKFTFEGRIAVTLERRADRVALIVSDTGTGIPAEELPRMFERFHRIAGARGRSYEGTGIGLALVQELVKLHGGAIEVESAPGRGTAFTVTLPLGVAHLPADRVNAAREMQSTAPRADAFVKEALQWLPGGAVAPDPGDSPGRTGQRVLLADDNADLREYVGRLLGEHYEVEAVADGEAALAAARAHRPDLIVADVMMPRLDGFGLIGALRASPGLRDVPVVVLSARAGEEARMEGIDHGADDYLVKPFSARELLVRVGALLRSADFRRQALDRDRRAAEQIRRSEQELADFFETAAIGLHWVGPDGIILRANQAELDLLGYRRDEYVGRHIAEFHVDRSVIDDIITRLKRGETLREHPAQLRRKDGSVRDVLINSSVLFENGRFIHTRCFTHDVTERKQAERTQARLAAIVESSDDAIVSKDLNSIIQSWNTGAQRLFGYTADEAIGQPITMLMLPDQASEEPGILARIRRGAVVEHYDTVRRRKDGTVVDISLTVSPIFDGQGRVVGASKIARDITQRKRAEQALREADRRKDEFLATLSHELRNPLAPIRNAVELLGSAEGNAKLMGQVRGILSRQVSGLVRLVDDLLELSRISRGTIALQKEEVGLADIVATAVETSRPIIEAAGHTLEVRLPQKPVMLHADAVRVGQVLTNLLNNAAKYTRQGGRIWLAVEPGADDVTVSVRDNGIGIDPEMLPRVFDMFVQAADGSGQSGLGIGLSLARSLTRMHGGSIEGRSDGPGRGSEFIVRLPTLASSQAVPAAATDAPAVAAARRAAS